MISGIGIKSESERECKGKGKNTGRRGRIMRWRGTSPFLTIPLYIGVIVATVGVIITGGSPIIKQLIDSASIEKAQTFLGDLDSEIRDLANQEVGSSKDIAVKFGRGEFQFSDSDDTVSYILKTESRMISPHTSGRVGNLVMAAYADVDVRETNINGIDCYLMENDYIKVCIRKVGSSNSYDDINASQLVTYFYNKDLKVSLDANLNLFVNGNATTSRGIGYTEPRDTGSYLGFGQVKAYIKSEYGIAYYIFFTLYSGSDFVQVEFSNRDKTF